MANSNNKSPKNDTSIRQRKKHEDDNNSDKSKTIDKTHDDDSNKKKQRKQQYVFYLIFVQNYCLHRKSIKVSLVFPFENQKNSDSVHHLD